MSAAEDEMTESITGLAKALNDLYDELGTWELVGKHYGVSRAVVWRIARKGYEPTHKSPVTRRKLGLPTIEMIPMVRNHAGRFTSND